MALQSKFRRIQKIQQTSQPNLLFLVQLQIQWSTQLPGFYTYQYSSRRRRLRWQIRRLRQSINSRELFQCFAGLSCRGETNEKSYFVFGCKTLLIFVQMINFKTESFAYGCLRNSEFWLL